MANRKFLMIVKRARAGDVAAQLALGKVYLSGGYGLQPSPASALFWLARAAKQNNRDAFFLIGSLFPPELTSQLGSPDLVRTCYQVAVKAGMIQAHAWLARLDEPQVRQMLPSYLDEVPMFITHVDQRVNWVARALILRTHYFLQDISLTTGLNNDVFCLSTEVQGHDLGTLSKARIYTSALSARKQEILLGGYRYWMASFSLRRRNAKSLFRLSVHVSEKGIDRYVAYGCPWSTTLSIAFART